MFYVKQASDPSRELVLKIYNNDDRKSYLKELAVFKKIKEILQQDQLNNSEDPLVGYP